MPINVITQLDAGLNAGVDTDRPIQLGNNYTYQQSFPLSIDETVQ
jgi:hypothetical protein